jgi:hypothetical protein
VVFAGSNAFHTPRGHIDVCMDKCLLITHLNPEGLGLLHRARRSGCETNVTLRIHLYFRQMTKIAEAAMGDPDAKRAGASCVIERRYAVTHDLTLHGVIAGEHRQCVDRL